MAARNERSGKSGKNDLNDEEYLTMERSVISITFGECVENHAGMQKIGERAEVGQGLSVKEMREIKKNLIGKRFSHVPGIEKRVQLFNLKSILETRIQSGKEPNKIPEGVFVPDAAILIIKNGVDLLFGEGYADKLFGEQCTLETDKKMYAYGRVVEKRIRHNLCFADFNQDSDFENGKGTVVSFGDMPHSFGESRIPLLKRVREELGMLNPKLSMLFAEGNYYYDKDKCGITNHGDFERRKVLCLRLGADFPISYQWYHGAMGGIPFGSRIETTLNHGDIYIMSEEAVGTEWTNKTVEYRNRFTLRHAAGFEKLIATKPKKKRAVVEREGYVINPKTGKLIKIGGPTYKKMQTTTSEL